MPHAVIEYSANIHDTIEAAQLSELVHRAMVESGLFNAPNIKTRSYKTDDFHVGLAGRSGSFVHITVSILRGRTQEQREILASTLMQAIRLPLQTVDEVTIDVHEMAKETYRKSVQGFI